MARQVGPTKMIGTFNDLCFYKSGDDYLVRMKGGPSKKQMMASPSFARTRENIAEFGACVQAGAFLRKSLKLVLPVSDQYSYQRMTKLMCQVKNYDTSSVRGARKVSEGFKHAEAKQLFYDFSFNLGIPLNTVLTQKPVVTDQHELLVDGQALVFPAGAARALISGALLMPDFETKTCAWFAYTEGVVFAEGEQPGLRLSLSRYPDKKTMSFYFLQIRFFAEDGSPLQQGALDSLGCIAVDPVEVQSSRSTLQHSKKKQDRRGSTRPGHVKFYEIRDVFRPAQRVNGMPVSRSRGG